MMPFFTTSPISRISPIADETLRSVPVSSSSSERAAERKRRRNQNQCRRHEGAELNHQHRHHQKRADAEHHQQLAERLALRLGTARRFRRCSRWAASASASRLMSATALPDRVPSSRPLMLAMLRRFSRSSSDCPFDRDQVRDAPTPARACRRRSANQRVAAVSSDRNGTHPAVARAPAPGDRAAAVRSPRRRATPRRAASTHLPRSVPGARWRPRRCSR